MAEANEWVFELSSAEWSRLERVVERFERAWRQGENPAIDAFLPAAAPERRAVLPELVHADLECRLKAGRQVAVEEYLQRYPELAADRKIALDLIAVEYALRQRRDPSVTPAEYSLRFPQYQGQLTPYLDASGRRPRRCAIRVRCPHCQHSFSVDSGISEAASCPACGDVLPLKFLKGTGLETNPLALPGYEILEELGRGGMGIVYKARQLNPDRLVAIKVLRPEQIALPAVLRRFQREAQAVARLNHPNIVRLYDSGQSGEHFFLCMEYVAGVNLHRLVDQSGPPPVGQACDFIRQAALGLEHAFGQGLIHRDIKPPNLILTRSGEAGDTLTPGPLESQTALVKILDMGLARLEPGTDQRASSHLTQEGALIGTPDYIAPEQAENPHLADIRSDLYSLGCTLYYVLTGQVPFAGGTLIQKLDRHRWQTPTPPDRLRPGIPPGVAAVVGKLLAKRPAERYQRPAEVAAALESFVRYDGAAAELPGAIAAPDPDYWGREPLTASAVQEVQPSRSGPREELTCFEGHSDWVPSVAFSPNGRLALSGSFDHTVRLWEVASGREVGRFASHTGPVLAVAFFPGGGYALSGGVDQTVRLWALEGAREILCFRGHTDYVWGVAFSPDGHHALSGSADRTIRLWGASGRELRRFEGHQGEVHGIAVSADGRYVLSGSADRTVRLWDKAGGRELRCFRGHTDNVAGVAFSPDGRRVLSGSADKTVRLWDVDTGRELQRFEGHTQAVRCVAFSPDGRAVLSGANDTTLRLWDVATGRPVRQFHGHTHNVTSVAFLPDGGYALSGSADKTVRLWGLPK